MASSSPVDQLLIKEEDVTRLIIEFLSNRDLSISQMSLERETGVHNGYYSDDVLFLRQLVLDGQWDDALMFIKPIEAIENFEPNKVRYLLLKHKFLEMLCLQAEASYNDPDSAVTELVACMNQLEKYCPSKDEYNELCMLLTLPSINHDTKHKNWNPSNSRVQCFNEVLKLVEKFMPPDASKVVKKTSKNDRLVRLLIKGLLYETCMNYCQQVGSSTPSQLTKHKKQIGYSNLFDESGSISSFDLSLLSWLQSIPQETFSCAFEPKILAVDVEKLDRPSLTAVWSEMILVTPIKPKVFPHTATPFTRVKGTDIMSKSLTPGLVEGISRNMTSITVEDNANNMSRSSMPSAGFMLSGDSNSVKNGNKKKGQMHISLERSFMKGDGFDSLPTIKERTHELASPMKTPDSVPSQNSTPSTMSSPAEIQQPYHVNHRPDPRSQPQSLPHMVPNNDEPKAQDLTMSGLWREFQKQKRILERLIGDDEDSFLTRNTASVIAKAPNTVTSTLYQSEQYHCTPEAQLNSMAEEDRYLTPVNQMGQRNYPDPQRLTTSTPKGSYYRNRQLNNGHSPHQSPIDSNGANTTLNAQQQLHQPNMPFDATCSTINSPPPDFSITYLGSQRNRMHTTKK